MTSAACTAAGGGATWPPTVPPRCGARPTGTSGSRLTTAKSSQAPESSVPGVLAQTPGAARAHLAALLFIPHPDVNVHVIRHPPRILSMRSISAIAAGAYANPPEYRVTVQVTPASRRYEHRFS